ncbi:uncharacterized protein LOC111624647 [Centruroides sculpturatus]|uniref:uncharacterized protein LOC111624647 n=1 Tax=Centruroides sculpturatus TaxID=218467 RepID=UPI000C6CBFC2|nr:uncharacterized protein LOC111624647 [Centruroides sculpturatus]
MASCMSGVEGNPVKQLRFSSVQDLSHGHFDVYLPYEDELSTSIFNLVNSDRIPSFEKCTKKRCARFTNTIRKKKLLQAATKYQQKNPEVNRTAAAKYKKNNPKVHRVAAAHYQQNHPEVHRVSAAHYQKNYPEIHRAVVCRYEHKNRGKRMERRLLPWKIKTFSGMKYDPKMAYETDKLLSLGTMSHKCLHCNALKFKKEAPGMCCSAGKVQLPAFLPLSKPLNSLLMGPNPEHIHFMDRIRKYACFQMTSFGVKQVIEDGFMPTFKVQGQVYHLIGSLQPLPQKTPQFLQIYFVGEDEREANLRCSIFPDVKKSLIKQLQAMLHYYNPYLKDLKTALEKVPHNFKNLEVVIHADRKPANAHRGCFNALMAIEVVWS